ncbi:PLP-dependent aminotransferase family protein [Pantoea cypripedii]|uniref:DNA-binding protein n=1 Tax=Pantoea cypripedii TaxID=55209 RepID=A0A1X1ER69_PANCY|nr:PLP-dependent aminotransferase family protein [Pantoea cypripedii]MBP2196371.1 GntR family transcriptional regulator/MocR family aminotransferase [Pantoea cypripedii]ORM92363.1 DNA-binding protein [Pantoea cypripedii]
MNTFDLSTLLLAPLRCDDALTLQQQLFQRIRQAILAGKLPAGTRLPATRQLAAELQVSRNTVIAVWAQLQAEGFLTSDRQGSRVSPIAQLPQPSPDPANATEIRVASRVTQLRSSHRTLNQEMALRPGIPALSHFPLAQWRRAFNRVMLHQPQALMGYGDPLGERTLREALAQHLALARGVRCTPEQIVITEGAQQALSLCVLLLSNPGETGWVEEPGYRGAKAAMRAGDMRIEPVAVDAQGLAPQPEDWQQRPPRLIYTTPTHQYPTGVVMSASRRLTLLAAATEHQAWIIEDDYDSDFRYSGEPIAAMQGMAPQTPVIYVGSFSKTLFPALRLGFMVLPAQLVPHLRPALHELLRGGNRPEQQALAHFLRSGDFSRHLSKMRRLYRQRQATLRAALMQQFGAKVPLLGGECGMHLVMQLPASLADITLVDQLIKTGYAPGALSGFYLGEEKQQGLVLGYGNTSTSQIGNAVAQLARLLSL